MAKEMRKAVGVQHYQTPAWGTAEVAVTAEMWREGSQGCCILCTCCCASM